MERFLFNENQLVPQSYLGIVCSCSCSCYQLHSRHQSHRKELSYFFMAASNEDVSSTTTTVPIDDNVTAASSVPDEAGAPAKQPLEKDPRFPIKVEYCTGNSMFLTLSSHV